MTRQPIHLVRTAAAELAAVEGRQVLRAVDAVALGTGSYKPRDARTLRDSYLSAVRPAKLREPIREPDAVEREWLGLDLIEQMRADGKLVH